MWLTWLTPSTATTTTTQCPCNTCFGPLPTTLHLGVSKSYYCSTSWVSTPTWVQIKWNMQCLVLGCVQTVCTLYDVVLHLGNDPPHQSNTPHKLAIIYNKLMYILTSKCADENTSHAQFHAPWPGLCTSSLKL